jgi:cytochrome c biogenesis protein CcmG, thiol:disulfide interchange protein DsbE
LIEDAGSYSRFPASQRFAFLSEPNALRIVITELTTVRANVGIGRPARLWSAFLLALFAVVVAGCGAEDPTDGSHPDYDKALAGSPPELAAVYRQGNELLPGGEEALERRIDGLHGYPVVVNVWASWCGPCRFEFPSFQDLSAEYGKRVAFLGVDSIDNDDAARTFLEQAPVPYPSYADPDDDVRETLSVRGLPNTAYYDRGGELCYVKQGQYQDHSDLESDLRRYALREECDSA